MATNLHLDFLGVVLSQKLAFLVGGVAAFQTSQISSSPVRKASITS